ncbi:unnamed protein product, partial [Rotaria sp. Silwood1]
MDIAHSGIPTHFVPFNGVLL